MGSTTNYFVLEMGLKFEIDLFIRDNSRYQVHIFRSAYLYSLRILTHIQTYFKAKNLI